MACHLGRLGFDKRKGNKTKKPDAVLPSPATKRTAAPQRRAPIIPATIAQESTSIEAVHNVVKSEPTKPETIELVEPVFELSEPPKYELSTTEWLRQSQQIKRPVDNRSWLERWWDNADLAGVILIGAAFIAWWSLSEEDSTLQKPSNPTIEILDPWARKSFVETPTQRATVENMLKAIQANNPDISYSLLSKEKQERSGDFSDYANWVEEFGLAIKSYEVLESAKGLVVIFEYFDSYKKPQQDWRVELVKEKDEWKVQKVTIL